MTTESWTIGRLLTWTTDYLKEHGSGSARLDAEVLLAHARSCERIELYTAFEQEVDLETREAFRQFVRRRASGEPVAYLVGHKEFYSLSFLVSPDVLIPRPETEHLVLCALDLIKESSSKEKAWEIADVGTGSGAIAITVAKYVPESRITATDISPAAIQIAKQNAQSHSVADRIEFQVGDLLSEVPKERKLDFVVSNPPYIAETEENDLENSVRDYEPHLALFGGPNGTEIIARLIPQAAERLQSGGWLLIEISPMIQEAVASLIDQVGDFSKPTFEKDLAGLIRIVKAQRK